MILAEIITIGDELLIGQVIDTNSAWLGQKLNEIGIKVKQITTVSDDRDHLLKAFAEAQGRADLVLITGGLGPTKDDLTKKTLCEFFGVGLVFHSPSFEIISELFKSRGREITETNKLQAMVLENCSVLINKNGTAPGMWIEHNQTIFISMPGVPNEMKGLMENEVIPRFKERFKLDPILHRTILTQGIGESFLSDLIEKWELALPSYIKLAYLPGAGILRLRLTASGKSEALLNTELDNQIKELKVIAGEFIFGYESDSLEEIIGKLLVESNKTLGTVESCTGGFLAHKITSISGSSAYYQGSILPYSNTLKMALLNVEKNLIDKHGAVSKEVVSMLAENGKKILNTDYCIATSGIAGPTGGSEEKPVGTVWIAIAHPAGTLVWKVQLGSNRIRIISETALHALNGLRKLILQQK